MLDDTTYEWTCAHCGTENRVLDDRHCAKCGKEVTDEKCLRHRKMKAKTIYYGLHHFKLDPREWSIWQRKAIKKWFNKFGYGDAIIKGESRSKK